MVTVRSIAAEEWRLFKDVRLRALSDAPDAFSSTLAEEAAEPDSDWEESAQRAAAGDDLAVFLAIEGGGHAVGMAGGFVGKDERVAVLWGMWVDPAARRQGIAERLATEVERWARQRGKATLSLWVAQNNATAIALYERLGFADTGDEKPLGSNAEILERRMAKAL